MKNNHIDNLILKKADRLSELGEDVTNNIFQKNISGLNTLLEFYINNKELLKPLPKLLDGEEIMLLVNIKPSPQLGYIINELHEAQLSGDVLTKEDAVKFVKNIKI